MPRFGRKSQNQLNTCHPDLQRICNECIKIFDFSVIGGHRGKNLQNMYFEQKRSKVRFPDSNHNKMPSMAVDLAPWPINWEKVSTFKFLAGHLFGIAHMLFEDGKITHKLRWGGDWDSDKDMHDQTFNDLGHFELIKPKT